MKLLLALIAALALAGCATQPEIRYVTKPPERVLTPPEPAWVVETLQESATVQQKLKAMEATALQCIGYVDELKTTFKPFTREENHGTATDPAGEDAPR